MLLVFNFSFSQKDTSSAVDDKVIANLLKNDSIENTFKFQRGTITLSNGNATLIVPPGFKYLDGVSAEKVLTEFWGNPPSETKSLGLIMPDSQKLVLSADRGYVFNIYYEDKGFVKDEDANDINYDDIMKEWKEGAIEENKERVKLGYSSAQIIGWASKPFYDKERKVLHWAKEIKFGNESDENTLNYDIRILGRKGVMTLQAITTMPSLDLVKTDIDKMLTSVQFNAGSQYKDFDSKVDNVAAWTIGGLVAGKVLAKVGFFAVIAKFGKIIIFAIIGFFAFVWNKIRGKKKQEPVEEVVEKKPVETIEPEA